MDNGLENLFEYFEFLFEKSENYRKFQKWWQTYILKFGNFLKKMDFYHFLFEKIWIFMFRLLKLNYIGNFNVIASNNPNFQEPEGRVN